MKIIHFQNNTYIHKQTQYFNILKKLKKWKYIIF